MHAYHTLIVRFAQTRLGGWMFLNVFNPVDKRLMRWTNAGLNSGIGTELQDYMALLRCTGAKSGKLREVPLLATPLEDRFVLIAGAAGQETNPDWYFNLKTNPACSLLVRGRGEIQCIAHEAEGKERERGWAVANAKYPGYAVYQGRTQRLIPVMILSPRSPE